MLIGKKRVALKEEERLFEEEYQKHVGNWTVEKFMEMRDWEAELRIKRATLPINKVKRAVGEAIEEIPHKASSLYRDVRWGIYDILGIKTKGQKKQEKEDAEWEDRIQQIENRWEEALAAYRNPPENVVETVMVKNYEDGSIRIELKKEDGTTDELFFEEAVKGYIPPFKLSDGTMYYPSPDLGDVIEETYIKKKDGSFARTEKRHTFNRA